MIIASVNEEIFSTASKKNFPRGLVFFLFIFHDSSFLIASVNERECFSLGVNVKPFKFPSFVLPLAFCFADSAELQKMFEQVKLFINVDFARETCLESLTVDY